MARHVRRLIFWTTGTLLSLALLAALAIALLIWGIDPDVHRARVERAATQALGRRVELTGPLRWRPGLAFEIESRGGRIASSEGFGNEPLASWQSLRLGVALGPLLQQRVVIDRIELQGLQVHLLRSAAGANWRIPAAPAAQPESSLSLAIGRIALRDAVVEYADSTRGISWSASDLGLEVELPALLQAPVLRLSGLSMQARLQGPPLRQEGVAVQLRVPRVEMDRQRGRVQVPEWQMTWDEADFSGGVDASVGAIAGAAEHAGPSATGTLRVQAASLRRLLQSVSVAAPATRDATALGPVSLDAQFTATPGSLELTQVDLRLDATRMEGSVRVPGFAPPSVRFELAADEVDLNRYLTPRDAPGKPLSLPLAQLKALDAKGVITLRRARVGGAAARGMRIDVE